MIKIAKVGDRIEGPAVYVGRNPHIAEKVNTRYNNALGNPFIVGKHGERGECIEKFDTLFTKRVKARKNLTPDEKTLLNRIYKLAKNGDVTLICHCHPEPCHASVIKRLVEEEMKKRLQH